MQLARVQTTLEHSTHASEALASAGQATYPRAARASLNPTRTTRPGLPARRSAPARPILSSCAASPLAMPSAINGYPDARRATRRQHNTVASPPEPALLEQSSTPSSTLSGRAPPLALVRLPERSRHPVPPRRS